MLLFSILLLWLEIVIMVKFVLWQRRNKIIYIGYTRQSIVQIMWRVYYFSQKHQNYEISTRLPKTSCIIVGFVEFSCSPVTNSLNFQTGQILLLFFLWFSVTAALLLGPWLLSYRGFSTLRWYIIYNNFVS